MTSPVLALCIANVSNFHVISRDGLPVERLICKRAEGNGLADSRLSLLVVREGAVWCS
jgi:hypothetical protein